MSDPSGLDRFLRIATPEGATQPELHFYAARAKGRPALVSPRYEGTARTWLLSDEAWAYQVDVFELVPRIAPSEVPGELLRGLENLVAQGATLAWLMFDAAFDGVDSLATEWGARNTYGIAGAAMPPCLALTENERTAADWREAIRRAVADFDRGLGGGQR